MPAIPDTIRTLSDVTGTATIGYAPIWNGTGFDIGGTQKLADGQLSSNIPLKNATNTFTAAQTFNNGFSVTGGSASMGAASCTTLAASSNATVGGTLGVTGASTFTSGSFTNNSTTAPPLILTNNASAAFVGALRMIAPNLTAGQFVGYDIGQAQSTGNSASIGFTYQGNNSAANSADFYFWGLASPAMSVRRNGNVLVGSTTDNGTDKLQVSGSATFSSTIKPGSINTATTAGTSFGQIVADNSGGANSGHAYMWNGSSWLKLDN